jgi:DNA polymerase III subunit epsilon
MSSARPPGRKERRHPWRDVGLAALDFETTGLDLRRDSVISFGVVPVDRGRIVVAGARYREAAPEVQPSPQSIVVHELLPGRLAEAPPLEAVRDELADALAGRFVLAWAAEIETGFLSRILGGSRRRWVARTVDVRELAKALAGRSAGPREPVGTLSDAAARFGLPVERAHHAFDDALMTAELFLVMAAKLEPYGYGSLRSFLRETRGRRRWYS